MKSLKDSAKARSQSSLAHTIAAAMVNAICLGDNTRSFRTKKTYAKGRRKPSYAMLADIIRSINDNTHRPATVYEIFYELKQRKIKLGKETVYVQLSVHNNKLWRRVSYGVYMPI